VSERARQGAVVRSRSPRATLLGAVYPFERFSDDAKRVLIQAQQVAEDSRHSYIGTEHVLLGLLQGDSGAKRILVGLGVDETSARDTIERVLGGTERIVIQQIVPTSRVKKMIELSFTAAEREASPSVTPDHLVIGLLEEGEGVAAHALGDMGVTLERFQQAR
jgi:ATP-dependent Clp protease ATP-binding subunit ClpC